MSRRFVLITLKVVIIFITVLFFATIIIWIYISNQLTLCPVILQKVDYIPSAIDLTSKTGLIKIHEETYSRIIFATSEVQSSIQVGLCRSKNDDSIAQVRGTTNWSWNYDYLDKNNAECGVNNIAVGVHTKTFYPKWENISDRSPELQRRWKNFMANLTLHENGHIDIINAGGQRIYDYLKNQSAINGCLLKEKTNAHVYEMLSEIDFENKAYDKSTEHGARQGVVWPSFIPEIIYEKIYKWF